MSESTHVVVLELPALENAAEIGIDPSVEAFETTWLGTPPRLLVLSRYSADTTLHLLDPHGPETVAEIRLASAVALYGSVGSHALVIGAQAAIVTAGESHLTPYQFPARVRPMVAGAAANQFVVALPGIIEEWDPASRVPKRRLRLPRPTTITSLGGSERVVWMVTQQDPARIDVLPLINRGQPKTHELPEPIASISGHPRSDLLVCVGASGRAYAVDLDGRTRLRSLAFAGLDRVDAAALVIGRSTGVLAAQHGRPLAFTPLDARETHAVAPVVPTRAEEPPEIAEPSSLVEPEPPRVVTLAAPTPAPIVESAPVSKTAKNLAARFAAVRERRELPRVASTPTPVVPTSPVTTDAPSPSPSPSPPTASSSTSLLHTALDVLTTSARSLATAVAPKARAAPDIEPRDWRDECARWAKAVLASDSIAAMPSAHSIEQLAARFDLVPDLLPALVLVYGAHLAGHDGVAPFDIARVLAGRWDEALGRGELAAARVATYERSRVRLATPVQRVLDELPPSTGTLVGVPREVALLGSCVVVGSDPLVELASRYADRVGGALLVAECNRADASLEARALGCAVIMHASAYDGSDAPVLYVAADEDAASRTGLPRFA